MSDFKPPCEVHSPEVVAAAMDGYFTFQECTRILADTLRNKQARDAWLVEVISDESLAAAQQSCRGVNNELEDLHEHYSNRLHAIRLKLEGKP